MNAPRKVFHIVDYMRVTASAIVDAAGVATVEFEPVRAGYLWRIERVTTALSTGGATGVILYAGPANPANVIEQTNAPTLNVADESQPITVPENVAVRAVFAGATVAAVATVTLQILVLEIDYPRKEAPKLLPDILPASIAGKLPPVVMEELTERVEDIRQVSREDRRQQVEAREVEGVGHGIP